MLRKRCGRVTVEAGEGVFAGVATIARYGLYIVKSCAECCRTKTLRGMLQDENAARRLHDVKFNAFKRRDAMPGFDMTARCFEGDVKAPVQFAREALSPCTFAVVRRHGRTPLRAHARGTYGFTTVSRQFNDSFPTVAGHAQKHPILGAF